MALTAATGRGAPVAFATRASLASARALRPPATARAIRSFAAALSCATRASSALVVGSLRASASRSRAITIMRSAFMAASVLACATCRSSSLRAASSPCCWA
uniref:Orf n=1 Tax=Acinetobacter baumannii TaxID=470 RepID=A0A088NIY3_ACIBA|nr:orf [Acinetobacter baumannii]